MKQNYFNGKKDTTLTRISKPSHKALKDLAGEKGMKMMTTLELLLRGDINVKELKYEKTRV